MSLITDLHSSLKSLDDKLDPDSKKISQALLSLKKQLLENKKFFDDMYLDLHSNPLDVKSVRDGHASLQQFRIQLKNITEVTEELWVKYEKLWTDLVK